MKESKDNIIHFEYRSPDYYSMQWMEKMWFMYAHNWQRNYGHTQLADTPVILFSQKKCVKGERKERKKSVEIW